MIDQFVVKSERPRRPLELPKEVPETKKIFLHKKLVKNNNLFMVINMINQFVVKSEGPLSP